MKGLGVGCQVLPTHSSCGFSGLSNGLEGGPACLLEDRPLYPPLCFAVYDEAKTILIRSQALTLPSTPLVFI